MSGPLDDENPFASPTVVERPDAGYEHLRDTERVPMPAAVKYVLWYALVSCGLWDFLVVFDGPGFGNMAGVMFVGIPTVTVMLAVAGIASRSRLGFRFLKVVMMFFVALTLVISGVALWAVIQFEARLRPEVIVMIVFSAATVGAWVAVDRRSAKVYFRLQCPRCGKIRNRATDFLFTRAKCVKCRVTW